MVLILEYKKLIKTIFIKYGKNRFTKKINKRRTYLRY